MNDKEFDEIMQLAVLELAAEKIPHEPHTFPPDFEARLMKKAGVSEQNTSGKALSQKAKSLKNTPNPIRKTPAALPVKINTFCGLAAGLLAVLAVGTIYTQYEGELIQSSGQPPFEAVDGTLPDGTAMTAITETGAEVRTAQTVTTIISMTEFSGVSQTAEATEIIETADNARPAGTEPPQTSTAETASPQTQPPGAEPPVPAYETGDVNMDGQITDADMIIANCK